MAGLKDKRARTTQRARVMQATPKQVVEAVKKAGFKPREVRNPFEAWVSLIV